MKFFQRIRLLVKTWQIVVCRKVIHSFLKCTIKSSKIWQFQPSVKRRFLKIICTGILNKLGNMNSKLEDIQRSLDMYLETKRQIFPRFYFISNDDLLEILGNSKNPPSIQPHLKKCFDNIKSLKMAMASVVTLFLYIFNPFIIKQHHFKVHLL